MKSIPYGKQEITEEDINAVVECLKSDFLTQGPAIETFEKKFAEYVGAKYAIAVSNGTAALHIAAMALNVNEGSRVITTPITFVASANCVFYCGGEVEFCDIDPQTALIDLNKLKVMLRQKPKGYYSGVIPVDFAGLAVNQEELREIADEYGLWIIEDACHAPGGYFVDKSGNKQLCGNGQFAELSVFSFHPVKHIACGEGGMITTNDKSLYQKLLQLRTHGITKSPDSLKKNDGGWYYEMQTLGYNYRLTDFQAALGTSQLQNADSKLQRRIEIAKIYDEAFKNSSIDNSIGMYREGNAYHLYIIKSKERKKLYDRLRENNVFAQVHYIPAHLQPYYQERGWKKGDFPLSEAYYEECLSLPMFPSLSDAELKYVIDLVLNHS